MTGISIIPTRLRVRYNGYDAEFDKRIIEALEGIGLSWYGQGAGFKENTFETPSQVQDLVQQELIYRDICFNVPVMGQDQAKLELDEAEGEEL